ncbi:MAG: AAA family ATPase [Thermodesulfobacteriota bacterium]|nr:AAA family ATPase [Thermodesulfobacteriota bacterium]
MYNNFFGFKERPFKLVPNPTYLFLSRSHKEALAHLTYAVSQGDGFVEITGEVGTGKTTLCRAFLESLDENTESAYIFNPKLDSIQLLTAINDEFGISSQSAHIKDLIDALNSFLMEMKTRGKKVILVIDEAQNLSKEVLEQLRLLSNLETTVDKLLQIVLVGQPELGEMLDSEELRQLGQRITLSCHLTPLTYKETIKYIQHRINIASQKQGVKFNRTAYGHIYKYSRGIPRLINIVCDRALLTAFGLNHHKIAGDAVRASIKELAGQRDIKHYTLKTGKGWMFAFTTLCIALFIAVFFFSGTLDISTNMNVPKNKKSEIAPHEQLDGRGLIQDQKEKSAQTEPSPDETNDLKTALNKLDEYASRKAATKAVMDLWNVDVEMKTYLDGIGDDLDFFRLVAKQSGLLIHRMEGDLNLVTRLNLPAILECHLPGSLSPRYLVLTKIKDEKITIRGIEKDNEFQVDSQQIELYWTGVAYIPWKNFFEYRGDIPINSSKDSIITLKTHLRDIGFNNININFSYDEKTRKAVKEIQEKHGIPVDGIVGPLTKIALYNEKRSMNIPHITDE